MVILSREWGIERTHALGKAAARHLRCEALLPRTEEDGRL